MARAGRPFTLDTVPHDSPAGRQWAANMRIRVKLIGALWNPNLTHEEAEALQRAIRTAEDMNA